MAEPGDRGSLVWWCPNNCKDLKYGEFISFLDYYVSNNMPNPYYPEFGAETINTVPVVMTQHEENYFTGAKHDYGVRNGQVKEAPICPKCGATMTLDICW